MNEKYLKYLRELERRLSVHVASIADKSTCNDKYWTAYGLWRGVYMALEACVQNDSGKEIVVSIFGDKYYCHWINSTVDNCDSDCDNCKTIISMMLETACD